LKLFVKRLKLAFQAVFLFCSLSRLRFAMSYVPIAGGDPELDIAPVREEYRKAVADLHASADAVDVAAKALDEAGDDDDRDALEATLKTAGDDLAAARAKADQYQARIELFERTQEARSIALPDTPDLEAAGGTGAVRVTKEELTYRQHGEYSVFRDLYNRDVKHDQAAAERLSRHMTEMEAEGKFDLSSTDAAGGYLVAPLYLQEEFVDRATAGRVITDAIGVRSLPPNTDSINIPKISTGTSVADQADNEAVSETDATFGTLAADVKTKAGMQDVSQQLVDRSVPGIDEIIFADLTKEYAVRLDTDVINSAVSNNKGLLQVTGVNAVTYTDASPTLAELYPKIADGVQQIHTGIYMPPTAIFMHPRRWAFCLAAQDGSQRPLVVPDTNAPQNAAGTTAGVVSVGRVGTIQGVPVYVDANIPTNLGAGTNEDRIIVVRGDELFIYEDASGPYLETFRDVGSGNLTVRFRLHNYWAQLNARRPKAISVISGTGLATPTF
jgi:HK97 family phage major capsid protein